jgi:hypothetical protein
LRAPETRPTRGKIEREDNSSGSFLDPRSILVSKPTKKTKPSVNKNVASTKKRAPTNKHITTKKHTPKKQRAQTKSAPKRSAPANSPPKLALPKTQKELQQEDAQATTELEVTIENAERQFAEEYQQWFAGHQGTLRAGLALDPSWLGHTTEQSLNSRPQRHIFGRTFPEPTTSDAQKKALKEITAQLHQVLQPEEEDTSSDELIGPSKDMTIRTAVNLATLEQMPILQFNQFHLPHRLVAMRNDYLQDKRSQSEKDKDLRQSLSEEHQSELQMLRGTPLPFPELKTYLGFLSMISTNSPKEINNTTFVLMIKAFQAWYHPKNSMSVDNLGRIDFDISHSVRECRHLTQPEYKKCIIAFRCYSI